MILDLIVAVLIVLAIIKGYQRGLIAGVFSFVAIIIGLAAAIKLSAVVADYLSKSVNISDQWLPIISFAVVFIIVVVLVRLGANAIQRVTEAVMLGWANRIGGVLLYVAIYVIIFSVALFYAEQIKLVKPETTKKSVTYRMVQPWGPKAVNTFGAVVPVFNDMFAQLENFFDGISERVASKK